MGCGRIDPRILNLGTSWRWVISFMPQLRCDRGKSPRYPLYGVLVGHQNQSERRGQKKSLAITGTRTPTRRSLGLLWRVMSPSRSFYLHKSQHKYRKTHTHTRKTSLSEVGFETTITASKRTKTVHATNNSAIVSGLLTVKGEKLWNELKAVKGQRKGRRLMKDEDRKY
jgi:hypothetical protein